MQQGTRNEGTHAFEFLPSRPLHSTAKGFGMKPDAAAANIAVRLDKWLWAVRLYKSRSLAAEACSNGKVQINGQDTKPARTVHLGEVITARTGDITRTMKVKGLLETRVGAKLVTNYLDDLTPPEELNKPRDPNFMTPVLRPKGAGRPTKRDRRRLDGLFGG